MGDIRIVYAQNPIVDTKIPVSICVKSQLLIIKPQVFGWLNLKHGYINPLDYQNPVVDHNPKFKNGEISRFFNCFVFFGPRIFAIYTAMTQADAETEAKKK